MEGCKQLYFASTTAIANVKWDDLAMVHLPDNFVRATLDGEDLRILKSSYQVMYPTLDLCQSRLGQVIKKYATVELGRITYGSRMSCRSLRSARVRAAWTFSDGTINSATLEVRPGFVNSFFSHEIQIQGHWTRHIFATMSWYKEHPSKDFYGNPVEVWQDQTLNGGTSTFMPVQRIASKFAAASQKVSDIDSIVVCPVPPRVFV